MTEINEEKFKAGIKFELGLTQKRVYELLSKYEMLRNDDNWLLFSYWREYDGATPEDMKLKRLTPAETITRARRHIQNKLNLLLPTDEEVLIKRRIKEEAVREYYAGNPGLIKRYEELLYGIK